MIECDSGGRCNVRGALTMTNVTRVLEESANLFRDTRLVVDLAGVTDVDSAAVSLLLEWQRQARAVNRHIEYVNLPPNLRSLADLYGVSELLSAR
jgi:phospholipid transport system transporter-binding protein